MQDLRNQKLWKYHPFISVFISPLGDADVIQVSFLAFKHIFKVEQDINLSSIDNCGSFMFEKVKER